MASRTLKKLIQSTLIAFAALAIASCGFLRTNEARKPFSSVRTFGGINKEFGEPFGVAVRNGDVYVSDGEKGKIWRIAADGGTSVFAEGLDTPSQIVFDEKGDLIVADSGNHTIKRIQLNGQKQLVAGIENQFGYRDGAGPSALFNAPIGLAVDGKKIFVADTYNDRIRVIENGAVTTLAGNSQGFSDDTIGTDAQFDTPCGLALLGDGSLLVADAGNRRIRVVEDDGKTWTLAGSGRQLLVDGLLSEAEFVHPTAISVDDKGVVYVADGNAIRAVGRRAFPVVETISSSRQGFADARLKRGQFNRPSGLATDAKGNLYVADSANQIVRVLTGEPIGKTIPQETFGDAQISAQEFRKVSPARWTYNPPERKREIAGTLGEIRGEIKDKGSQAWFHNGLDIVGGYGETARFIRDEKVLRPIAVQNFDTTRELLRMPTLGYIHIRLGRDVRSKPFDDMRFQFSFNSDGKPSGVRIPRGTRFKAGDAIGTLNAFNHVHLIAGRSGREMNALDALILPDASDGRPPTIQDVTLYDENWREIETERKNDRIELSGKTRIVLNAFDQMDGNASRRKLGLYKVGYQVFDDEENPVPGFEQPKWTIEFEKTPRAEAVSLVYAEGSKSGATGETIFRYIVTNEVSGTKSKESFFDARGLASGEYVLRVFAADLYGNITPGDIKFRK